MKKKKKFTVFVQSFIYSIVKILETTYLLIVYAVLCWKSHCIQRYISMCTDLRPSLYFYIQSLSKLIFAQYGFFWLLEILKYDTCDQWFNSCDEFIIDTLTNILLTNGTKQFKLAYNVPYKYRKGANNHWEKSSII